MSDPHLSLARSEEARDRVTPCSECDRPWEGNVSCEGAPVCDACHAAALLEWCPYGGEPGELSAWTPSGITVAKVLRAEEGEAEGGLAALARFMLGAFHPEVPQPPLSPAGWYWTGTTERRGIWRKDGPFATPEEARDACVRAFALGAYLLND